MATPYYDNMFNNIYIKSVFWGYAISKLKFLQQ